MRSKLAASRTGPEKKPLGAIVAIQQAQTRLCVIGEADPFIARLLMRFAQKGGLRTRRAQTGEDLLALMEREQPALILLEPELPGRLRGWEACQKHRGGPAGCEVPVIVCSWLTEDEARAKIDWAAAYLHKLDLHYEDFALALDKAGIREQVQRADTGEESVLSYKEHSEDAGTGTGLG